jgi:hypothetical protein
MNPNSAKYLTSDLYGGLCKAREGYVVKPLPQSDDLRRLVLRRKMHAFCIKHNAPSNITTHAYELFLAEVQAVKDKFMLSTLEFEPYIQGINAALDND